MRFLKLFPVCLLLLLVNCGGGNSNNLASSAQSPSVTGNWEINPQSAVSSGSLEIVGSLASNGSQVSGVLHVLESVCYGLIDNVSVSGSIATTTNSLSLTSGSVAGQVITISGMLSTDGKTLSAGSYAISGGCANGDHGTLSGFLVPPFTNTYTGTFTSFQSGEVANVSISVTQSQTPDAIGFFPVTGTATFANSTCFSSATATSAADVVFGTHLGLFLDTNDGGQTFLSATLSDSSGKTMMGAYQINSGTCAGQFWTGTLSHN